MAMTLRPSGRWRRARSRSGRWRGGNPPVGGEDNVSTTTARRCGGRALAVWSHTRVGPCDGRREERFGRHREHDMGRDAESLRFDEDDEVGAVRGRRHDRRGPEISEGPGDDRLHHADLSGGKAWLGSILGVDSISCVDEQHSGTLLRRLG